MKKKILQIEIVGPKGIGPYLVSLVEPLEKLAINNFNFFLIQSFYLWVSTN